MSENDQKAAKNASIEAFVNKVITAERIQHADSLIKSCDLLPDDLKHNAQVLFASMITFLEGN